MTMNVAKAKAKSFERTRSVLRALFRFQAPSFGAAFGIIGLIAWAASEPDQDGLLLLMAFAGALVQLAAAFFLERSLLFRLNVTSICMLAVALPVGHSCHYYTGAGWIPDFVILAIVALVVAFHRQRKPKHSSS